MNTPKNRIGVVLGAGGTLGAAWMIARLRALEQLRGFDTREVEVLVGSSAGSVLAAMIACGVSVQDLLDHQRGEADPLNPLAKAGSTMTRRSADRCPSGRRSGSGRRGSWPRSRGTRSDSAR